MISIIKLPLEFMHKYITKTIVSISCVMFYITPMHKLKKRIVASYIHGTLTYY